MSKTTLYLPVELQHRLRDEARRSGRSQAELVRDALTAFLSDRKRPLPSSIGVVDDGTLDASTVKDWIRSTWHEDQA
jgi:plasmid stability protein